MVAFTAEYESGEIVLDTNEMRAAGFSAKMKSPDVLQPISRLLVA